MQLSLNSHFASRFGLNFKSSKVFVFSEIATNGTLILNPLNLIKDSFASAYLYECLKKGSIALKNLGIVIISSKDSFIEFIKNIP